MNDVIQYRKTENLLQDVCVIIDSAEHFSYRIVDSTLVIRNWCIGKRIAEETLKGEDRAQLLSLRAEIEAQKVFYYLQKKEQDEE